jgi:hypothetical protein
LPNNAISQTDFSQFGIVLQHTFRHSCVRTVMQSGGILLQVEDRAALAECISPKPLKTSPARRQPPYRGRADLSSVRARLARKVCAAFKQPAFYAFLDSERRQKIGQREKVLGLEVRASASTARGVHHR